jgi:predicted DNA binding CopG/RHH family protein
MKKLVLDEEERDIVESSETGEWIPGKNPQNEKMRLRKYARSTLQKDKRINIRMSSKDLDQVQVLAAQEGIPYQTLVSSIIHKYVSGYLIEKKRLNTGNGSKIKG